MKKKVKSGFTLIEVMMAILILAALAMGGAAVLYQTGGTIKETGNKRFALELARSEMEDLFGQDYWDTRSQAKDDPISKPVNQTLSIITTDIILHKKYDPMDDEYLELDVQVQYGSSISDRVHLNIRKYLL